MSKPQSSLLEPVPRGSTPITSKRWRICSGIRLANWSTRSPAVLPGPPGLMNSGPMRSPVAFDRVTLILMVSPLGLS